MLRKLLLALIFLILFIFYSKHSAFASRNNAPQCGIMTFSTPALTASGQQPATRLVLPHDLSTKIDFTIQVYQGMLTNGKDYEIVFAGNFDLCSKGGCSDPWSKTTYHENPKRELKFSNLRPDGKSTNTLYEGELVDFFVYPIENGDFHQDNDPVCQQDFKVTLDEFDTAYACNINLSNYISKPGDALTATITNLDELAGINDKRFNIYRKTDANFEKPINPQSKSISPDAISNPIDISGLDIGNYIAVVVDKDGTFNLCQNNFSVQDPLNAGDQIPCPYCPKGTKWDDISKCLKPDGTETSPAGPLYDAPCSKENTCIPYNTESDNGSIKSICTNSLSSSFSGVDFDRNPPCTAYNDDKTCKSINSGLGIPLPVKASDFITALLGIVLSISGGIAVLLIIVSGYRLMVSQGNPEKIQAAKEELTAAIVGFLFIIFSLVILQVIGFDILHLPGFGS